LLFLFVICVLVRVRAPAHLLTLFQIMKYMEAEEEQNDWMMETDTFTENSKISDLDFPVRQALTMRKSLENGIYLMIITLEIKVGLTDSITIYAAQMKPTSFLIRNCILKK
jgi:hypothetical protein